MEFVTSATHANQWPTSEKEILLVGRSNVGKSTFLNRYAKKKIAYVGKTPGKTRLLNFFRNESYFLVDAPGYGYARRTFEEINDYQRMMEEYFAKRSSLKIIILLVDARHKPSKEDIEMMNYLRYHHFSVLVVATKVDKLKASEQKPNRLRIAELLQIPNECIWFKDLSKEKEMELLKKEIDAKMSSF